MQECIYICMYACIHTYQCICLRICVLYITQISQGNTVVTDSKTGRTINDILRDLISEVDDGTLTLLVSKQTQASQAHDISVYNEEVSYKF